MEREILIHLARTVNILTEIPVVVIDDTTGETLATFAPFGGEFSTDEEVNKNLAEKYKKIVKMAPGQRIGYYISDNLLGIGCIKDKDSNLYVTVGPCKLADINKNAAKNMLSNDKFTLTDPIPYSEDKFFNYLQRMPRVTPLYFLWLLSHINTAINQEAIQLSSFISMNPFFNQPDKQVDNIFIKKREYTGEYEDGEEIVKVEKTIISYIRAGNLEAVNRYWHETGSNVKSSSDIFLQNTLRQTKNNFITLVSLISRAVIDEGLSENLSCTLAASYIVRAESCLSVEEFDNLIPSMLTDFTKRIKAMKESNSDGNYIVTRAIAYINDHITEKIVVSDIADSLRISNGYLSALFKKSTGMYIPDFINKQKIVASQHLLDTTDKSLSEITTHFSFSSQSYYQNLFKKFTGQTPTEYRKKKNKNGGA